MASQTPAPQPPATPAGPSWPYIVLAVLLTAIGNNWAPADVEALGCALLALVAVAYAARK